MDSHHIHLLLIEDNPGDEGLIREMLAEAVRNTQPEPKRPPKVKRDTD